MSASAPPPSTAIPTAHSHSHLPLATPTTLQHPTHSQHQQHDATPATATTKPVSRLRRLVGVTSDDDTPLAGSNPTYSNIMHVPTNQYCRPGSWPAFKSNALAGAFALSTAFALMHPLDTIKTQLQVSTDAAAGFSRIFSASTGRSLLHGFTASIAGAAPQGAMRFSTYESTKLRIVSNYSVTHPYLCTPLVSSALGAMAGDMVSSIAKVPREVLTQRLQATKMYDSTWHAIKHIARTEGVRGFYTGYLSTQARDLPFMMFLFSCYENIKSLTGSLCEESSVASAAFGASSGALAGFFTTPMDVIKTKIMTGATVSPTGGKVLTLSMREATHEILAKSGWRGMFVGAVPRSVWWFGVCGAFFPLYETSKAVIHNYHAHRHGHVHDHDDDDHSGHSHAQQSHTHSRRAVAA